MREPIVVRAWITKTAPIIFTPPQLYPLLIDSEFRSALSVCGVDCSKSNSGWPARKSGEGAHLLSEDALVCIADSETAPSLGQRYLRTVVQALPALRKPAVSAPRHSHFDPLRTSFFSIELYLLMGAVQGEGGDLDVEAFAVPVFHLIAARHDA